MGVRAAVSAGVVAIALAVAGCGGGGEEPSTEEVSPEVVAGAVAKTREAGGVQLRMRHTSTNDAAEGKSTSITGTGVMDLGYRLGSLKLDMRSLGPVTQQATGERIDPSDFLGEIYVDNEKLYRRLPFITKAAGIRQSWIVSDGTEPTLGPGGVDFGHLPRINGNDLPQTFDDMTHLVDAKRYPDEHRTVAGVETTRHDAKVNIAETASGGEGFRSLTGSTQYPVKVWIDERGFARAVEWTVSNKVTTTDPNRLQNSRRTIHVTIERTGVRVPKERPPKNDTIHQKKVGMLGI
ncbi:MAG TPA: hypothetical protein VHF45_08105 [Thermoleophilaceae bacterium]|nr:hypothetical protein [Thermoleophilaceae bacterium]